MQIASYLVCRADTCGLFLGLDQGAGPVERLCAADDGDGNPGGVHGGCVFGSGVVPVDDDSDLCIVSPLPDSLSNEPLHVIFSRSVSA